MARADAARGVGRETTGRPEPVRAAPPPRASPGTGPGATGGPADLVVGLGARPGAEGREAARLVALALREARSLLGREPGGATGGEDLPGLGRDVLAVATVTGRAAEPAVASVAALLGVAVEGRPAAELAAVPVPHPADRVRAAVGTSSVAEAAALLVAGDGAELVVAKRTLPLPGRRAWVTCAVARRIPAAPGPRGPRPASAPNPARDHTHHTYQGAVLTTPPDARTAPLGVCGGFPPPPAVRAAAEPDLRHHGDAELRAAGGRVTDLAVNVRAGTPPAWLRERIAATLGDLAAYPDGTAARAAVAARHGVPVERVLLTSGAAEAFVLLARALRPRRPVVVHPQFTEPEAALRDAGHDVARVVLRAEEGFRLTPGAVPEEADLVVVGNPTNPTSVLHPAQALADLARPGRTLVVDEAFMDAVPGESESLAGVTDLPGLVVLRSLTKTWGLAGLRVGYVLAEPATVALLQRAQPLWPVSSPALAAALACCEPAAFAEAEAAAAVITADRDHLVRRLEGFAHHGVRVVRPPRAPFVLLRVPGAEEVRERLGRRGFALRRGDTFPGLGPDWLRLAVRDAATTDRLARAAGPVLAAVAASRAGGGHGGG